MSNLPRRSIEDHVAYDVVCDGEPSVRFRVVAESETVAKIQALDKIGYTVAVESGKFTLVDADDPDQVEAVLNVATFDQALTAAFRHINWSISEPTEMIGGSLGEGFGEVDDE
jgi:hypothetical protein